MKKMLQSYNGPTPATINNAGGVKFTLENFGMSLLKWHNLVKCSGK